MSKFAIRLLTLAMCTTALVVVPMVTPANTATNSSKEIKKKKKMTTHRSPGIASDRSPHPTRFLQCMMILIGKLRGAAIEVRTRR